MFLANIHAGDGDTAGAEALYRELIEVNRKYFAAYPALAKIWISRGDFRKARELLKKCLVMNPDFKDAITGLADSYRTTDPVIAKKYDDLAKTKQ
jgi:Tfp pilus assembly protein PilF